MKFAGLLYAFKFSFKLARFNRSGFLRSPVPPQFNSELRRWQAGGNSGPGGKIYHNFITLTSNEEERPLASA